MTLTQINHFITVAQSLSFTQAANALYVSQPAISKSISKLEDELGFKLFERSDSILSLTSAGEAMYEFFTKASAEYTAITDNIRALTQHPHATVRIGCPETWSPSYFYKKIENHFSANHPSVKFIIECYKLSDLISRLQAGKLDIVLTHDFFIPSLPNLSSRNLVASHFGILYSKEHFPEVTSPHDFSATPFALFDADIEKRFSDIIRKICADYGFTPKITTSGQLSSALFSTACGNHVMLFSSWDSAILNPSYGFLPLNAKMPVKILHMTDNPNKSIGTLVEEIQNLFSENP